MSLAQQAASIPGAYEAARGHQAAGELDEAKRIYGQILMAMPHHAESLIMLSSIGYQQGEDMQAEAYLDRAIEIYGSVLKEMPRNLHVRAPLINLLLARNRAAEAEALTADLLLPLNPIRATPEAFVRRRARGVERGLPALLINTLPKSASESIWNRLAEGLDLAQSHLSIGLFPDCCLLPARVKSAAEGGLIAKEHIPASDHNLRILADHGLDRLVFHVRDPRQAALSWAHFVRDDVSMRLMAPIWRKVVPTKDRLRGDFEGLLDWCIDLYLPLQLDFIRGWMEAERHPRHPVKALFLTFELFRTDPEAYFERLLAFLEIDPALFAAEAEAEVIHLRKGLLDEWREVFSPGQSERAWSLIPADMAEAFGWQP